MQCHDPIFILTCADDMQVGALAAAVVAEAVVVVAGPLDGLQTMLAWVPLAQVSKPAMEQHHMGQGLVDQGQLFWRYQDNLCRSLHKLQQQQAQLLQQLELPLPQQR